MFLNLLYLLLFLTSTVDMCLCFVLGFVCVCLCLDFGGEFFGWTEIFYLSPVLDIMPERIIALNSDLREVGINPCLNKRTKSKLYTSIATLSLSKFTITLER